MYRKPSILWPEGVLPSDAYCDEDKRLAVLAAHGTQGMVDDPELQELVDLVAKLCDVSMALMTVVGLLTYVYASVEIATCSVS